MDRSSFRFVTIHACDRQTDGQTDGRTDRNLITIPRLHYMQRGKNQKAKQTIMHCTTKQYTIQEKKWNAMQNMQWTKES